MITKYWQTFIIGWLFVIYEYAVRVSDGVILHLLEQDLSLKATHLSILSSAYYITYIASMIPVGILIDKFGMYRCWKYAIFLIAFGCFLFGESNNLVSMSIARIFMGFGSAFSVVGMFAFAISIANKASFIIAITMSMAMLGAILGQGPWLFITHILDSWRATYHLAGLFGILLWIFWINCKTAKNTTVIPIYSKGEIFKTFPKLLKSKVFWVSAIFMGCLSAPQTAFMALWGPQYITKAYQIPETKAAFMNSLISMGGFAGSLFIGYLGDKYSIKKLLLSVGLIATFCMLAIIEKLFISINIISLLLFFVGFVTNANVIVFAYLGRYFFNQPKTTVQSCANMFNMGGGPLFQILIGIGITIESTSLSSLTAENMQGPLLLIPLSLLFMIFMVLCTNFKPEAKT